MMHPPYRIGMRQAEMHAKGVPRNLDAIQSLWLGSETSLAWHPPCITASELFWEAFSTIGDKDMALSLKSEHLKRYGDIARLLIQHGRSDIVKTMDVDLPDDG